MMTELRKVHTIVDLDTILDLGHRVYWQGQAIVNCNNCKRHPQSPIVTLPALIEQCLSLFAAACTSYNIGRRNALLDTPALAFEESFPRFTCIKNKASLGQMELDDEETGQLVKMFLNRSLARLMKLLEMLKDVLRAWWKDYCHSFPVGTATLRACESSVESTIHRVTMFMEQAEPESSKNPRPMREPV